MRKLTDHDLTNLAGATLEGYHVEGIRIKRGSFTDSDHYGTGDIIFLRIEMLPCGISIIVI